MLLSSAIVTCLARSTACRTCCWCWDEECGEGGRSALLAGAPHGPASCPAAPGLCRAPFPLQPRYCGFPSLPTRARPAPSSPFGCPPPAHLLRQERYDLRADGIQPLDNLRLKEEAGISAATGLSARPAPPAGQPSTPGTHAASPQLNPPHPAQILPPARPCRDFPSCCQGRAAAARAAGPPQAARSPRTHGRESDTQTPAEPGQAELRARPLASSWLRRARAWRGFAGCRRLAGRAAPSRQRWRWAISILLPLPERWARRQRGAGAQNSHNDAGGPPYPPPPLRVTPQALPAYPPAPRLSPSQRAAAGQCGGPGAPSPARAAPSPPTARSLSRGRGRSLQPGLPATFPRENLTPPTRPTNPARLSPAEGLAALKCFLISGFLQSLTALQRGQTRHKAAENKGNIYGLLPEAACIPGRAQAAPQHPGHPQVPTAAAPGSALDPPAAGGLGDRDPRLQTAPAKAGPGVNSGQGAPPPRLPGPPSPHGPITGLTRPGHLWLPAPPELGAHGASRNVLEGSASFPANKRSKLRGAEPAGGIWQLTCHFVRHRSKLISLAESP